MLPLELILCQSLIYPPAGLFGVCWTILATNALNPLPNLRFSFIFDSMDDSRATFFEPHKMHTLVLAKQSGEIGHVLS